MWHRRGESGVSWLFISIDWLLPKEIYCYAFYRHWNKLIKKVTLNEDPTGKVAIIFCIFLMLLVKVTLTVGMCLCCFLTRKKYNFFLLWWYYIFLQHILQRNLCDCTSQQVRFAQERGALTKAEYNVAAGWNPSAHTTTQHKWIP